MADQELGLPCGGTRSRRGFYYGWAILFSSICLDLCTAPGHSTGINVFLDHLIAGVGQTRSGMALTYSTALFVSAMLTPWAGRAVDAYGAQRVAHAAVALFAAALVGISCATSALQLGVCFCVLRFAGPECMYVCANTTLYRWWVKRRGRVALIRSLDEVLLVSFPALIGGTLASIGWRDTYRVMAIAVLVIGWTASSILRETPEAHGLLPDGAGLVKRKPASSPGSTDDKPSVEPVTGESTPSCKRPAGDDGAADSGRPNTAANEEYDDEAVWPYDEVIREPFFWRISAVEAASCVFWAGMNFHTVDVMASRGLDREVVPKLSLALGAGITGSQVALGMVSDGLSFKQRRLLLLGSYVGLCLTILLLQVPGAVANPTQAAMWLMLYGVFAGAQFTIKPILMADTFGRKSLGSVNGISTAISTTASGCGPLFFAGSVDYTGSYAFAMQVCLAAISTSLVVFAAAPLPGIVPGAPSRDQIETVPTRRGSDGHS